MKNFFSFVFGIAILLATSCSSYKKVPYMMDAESFSDTLSANLYDARIMPKDILTITVLSFDQAASLPFNLVTPAMMGHSLSVTATPTMQTYLVDNDGQIDFPVLGRIKVGDMTKKEVENMLKDKLKTYFKDEPVVTVRMVNYKITVLGEVARPGTFTVANEKINIYEALAMAGDMTIFGKRNNVRLVRESSDGKKHIYILDLQDKNLISSPYFFLQQNDVIYVEPNKAKARSSSYSQTTALWLTATSILISLTSLIINLSRK